MKLSGICKIVSKIENIFPPLTDQNYDEISLGRREFPFPSTHIFPATLGTMQISLGKVTLPFFANLAQCKVTARTIKKTNNQMPVQKKKKEENLGKEEMEHPKEVK